ncbi:MAG: hypothetical protein ACQESR_01740 [Planctomycetota bacterium]
MERCPTQAVLPLVGLAADTVIPDRYITWTAPLSGATAGAQRPCAVGEPDGRLAAVPNAGDLSRHCHVRVAADRQGQHADAITHKLLQVGRVNSRRSENYAVKKQEVIDLVNRFPDEVDTERLIEELYLRTKLDRAERAVSEDRVVSQEAVEPRSQQWQK